MYLKDVDLEEAVDEKVFRKHGISREEIEKALLLDEPKHFRTRAGRYLAIGLTERYVSTIYENHNGIAVVITAYHSSQWQIKSREGLCQYVNTAPTIPTPACSGK